MIHEILQFTNDVIAPLYLLGVLLAALWKLPSFVALLLKKTIFDV